jgi:hypothetical protein
MENNKGEKEKNSNVGTNEEHLRGQRLRRRCRAKYSKR